MDKEVAANNKEVQKLVNQIYTLEENDKLRDEFDRVRDDDIAGGRLEVLSAALNIRKKPLGHIDLYGQYSSGSRVVCTLDYSTL